MKGARGETTEVHKGQTAFVNHDAKLDFYPKSNGKSIMGFQGGLKRDHN